MKCSGNIICPEVDNDIVEAKVTLSISFNEIKDMDRFLRAHNQPCLFSDLPFDCPLECLSKLDRPARDRPLTFVRLFIRLRRRPRALPVDECVSGVCASPEPRYHCFGGFRHWRITLRSLGACAPERFGAQGRRRVFLWRYHGLSPWGSIKRTPYREVTPSRAWNFTWRETWILQNS